MGQKVSSNQFYEGCKMCEERSVQECNTLAELFELWKSKPVERTSYYSKDKEDTIPVEIDHSNVFISDGPIDEGIWSDRTSGKHIMFLLKEAYGDSTGWSLNEWLNETGPSTNIWYRVVEWTYGISNTTATEIAKYSPSEISFEVPKSCPNEWLGQIAVMNIKKSGGKSSSDYDEILAYAKADEAELIREIEIIDPDIIVCGGTIEALDYLAGDTIKKERCDNWFYYTNAFGGRERLVLDYYHPANRYPALLNYYGITNIYQQALLEKEKGK